MECVLRCAPGKFLHPPRICTMFLRQLLAAVFALSPIVLLSEVIASQPCRIEVVDRENGWPVPLVELRTVHQVSLVTDNAGVVAIDQPDLMGRKVWLSIKAHGYELPEDGFGYRGVGVIPAPGKTIRIELERKNIAKRLGRITGAGLFAESQKTGQDLDWTDGPIVGCDSVQTAVHWGRRFWLWGDTSVMGYPLGEFHATSATTGLRPLEALTPPVKLQFNYFLDTADRVRSVARMEGEGPTWISAYVSLPSKSGPDRLVGSYVKVRAPMTVYERGLCVWNDQTESFEHFRTLWTEKDEEKSLFPDGHAVFWTDDTHQRWVLFGNPFPELRCRAIFEAWSNPEEWEPIERPETLVGAQGEKVTPHSGSIAWNGYRQRWVTVFMEKFGKPSAFGEVWYAEGKSPTGPWGPAVKVATHENYTFYNPRLHPEFTEKGSPVLLFEGTYTAMFADDPQPTPRYDYNQVLYRLDLDDPRLAPAKRGEAP